MSTTETIVVAPDGSAKSTSIETTPPLPPVMSERERGILFMLGSPSFWLMVLLMPIVWAIVGNAVGLWGAPLPQDVRSAILNSVIGLVLGGLIGYYYGQTTSRNRTP